VLDLLNALENDPVAVTYLPRDLATRPGLKIVGEL
jgi:hypothetical protein